MLPHHPSCLHDFSVQMLTEKHGQEHKKVAVRLLRYNKTSLSLRIQGHCYFFCSTKHSKEYDCNSMQYAVWLPCLDLFGISIVSLSIQFSSLSLLHSLWLAKSPHYHFPNAMKAHSLSKKGPMEVVMSWGVEVLQIVLQTYSVVELTMSKGFSQMWAHHLFSLLCAKQLQLPAQPVCFRGFCKDAPDSNWSAAISIANTGWQEFMETQHLWMTDL